MYTGNGNGHRKNKTLPVKRKGSATEEKPVPTTKGIKMKSMQKQKRKGGRHESNAFVSPGRAGVQYDRRGDREDEWGG